MKRKFTLEITPDGKGWETTIQFNGLVLVEKGVFTKFGSKMTQSEDWESDEWGEYILPKGFGEAVGMSIQHDLAYALNEI